MELIKNTVSNSIKRAIPWLGSSQDEKIPLVSLHITRGFYVFGFSIFAGNQQCNLKTFVFDFSEQPENRNYFDGPNRILSGTTINFNGQHAILKEDITGNLGILLCVEETEANAFVGIMRLLRSNVDVEGLDFWELIPGISYDKDTNKIIGAMTLSSALREYAAAQALIHYWSKEYESPCPVDLPIGIVETKEIPFYDRKGQFVRNVALQQAFTHPLLRDIPEEWRSLGGVISGIEDMEVVRVSDWNPKLDSDDELLAFIERFVLNVTRLVKIAHKYLGGTFTDEYSSALTELWSDQAKQLI